MRPCQPTSLSRSRSAGNQRDHRPATASVPKPPTTTAGTVPTRRGEHARFELAQLVRGADEHGVDRRHPAAHRVGRVDLDQGLADEHADHVGGAQDEQARTSRDRGWWSRPKPMVASAEHRHRLEHAPARAAIERAVGQEQRHQHRPRGRHAAQQAQAPGADHQDVAGVDRQERGGAAEQHREQVERDRPQDRRARADEQDAGDEAGPARLLAPAQAATMRDRGHQQGGGREGRRPRHRTPPCRRRRRGCRPKPGR